MNDVLNAAMVYAARGWPVFRLSANSKKPLPETRGFLDATADFSTLARWFSTDADLNIGLACGHQAGVYVLDVDVQHDGMTSIAALAEILGDESFLDVRTHRTTSGGIHLFYAWDDAMPMPRKINVLKRRGLNGLDLIGSDGYVVLPPSTVDGSAYSVQDDRAVGPAPAALVQVLREAMAAPEGRTQYVRGPRVTGQIRPPSGTSTTGMLSWLISVPAGHGQDHALTWVVRALRDEGHSAPEAADLLWEAMCKLQTNEKGPWTQGDLRRHIRSAYG